MSDKGIGFSRTIKLPWLNAAANFRRQTEDMAELRAALEPVLMPELSGLDARRKTLDVLVGIWHKTARVNPALHTEALDLYSHTVGDRDRLFLHYGLTLLYYPFFRHCAATLERFVRNGENPTRQMVKTKIATELGHFGALDRSVERIIASLTDWSILVNIPDTRAYQPSQNKLGASSKEFETWLLACALAGYEHKQILFNDLVQSPVLFPFKLTVSIDHLRADMRFSTQRQGEWEMVGLASEYQPPAFLKTDESLPSKV